MRAKTIGFEQGRDPYKTLDIGFAPPQIGTRYILNDTIAWFSPENNKIPENGFWIIKSNNDNINFKGKIGITLNKNTELIVLMPTNNYNTKGVYFKNTNQGLNIFMTIADMKKYLTRL